MIVSECNYAGFAQVILDVGSILGEVPIPGEYMYVWKTLFQVPGSLKSKMLILTPSPQVEDKGVC